MHPDWERAAKSGDADTLARLLDRGAEIDAKDSEGFDRLKVGDRVRILANHSCLTAAQHSHYNILENGEIVDRWEIHRGW